MADEVKKVIVIETQVNGDKSVDKVIENVKSLKQQIKKAKLEAERFEEGSEGFVKASENVAKLSDKLDDVNDQVKLLKGDALERVASGFKGIGSAILDLDVGKLKLANDSLKNIKFGDLIGNAKQFGGELLKLATNPLFLIPAAIGLIIANFDKLLEMFPALGTIVDGVKAIFDRLVNVVLDIINYAGDLYERFKPIINILFPITGLIEEIIDLLEEEANSAEASAKRRVESEEKYKDAIRDTNKELSESRRNVLVASGRLTQEQADREAATETFKTEFVRLNEEAKINIKKAANNEERDILSNNLKKDLETLGNNYRAQLLEIGKKEKAIRDEKIRANKEAQDKINEDNKKALEERQSFFNKFRKEDDLDRINREEKEATDRAKKLRATEEELINITKFYQEQRDAKIRANKEALDKINEDNKKAQEDEKIRANKEAQDKINEDKKNAEERQGFFNKFREEDDLERIDREEEEAIARAENLRATEEELMNIRKFYQEKRSELLQEELQEQINGSLQIGEKFVESMNSLNDLVTTNKLKGLEKGSKEEERVLKQSFERSKKLSIAQSIISGLQGVINALSAKSTLPEPFATALKAATAISIGVSTAANIAKIKAQQFNSTSNPQSDTNINTGGGSGGSDNLRINAPSFNLQGQQIGGASGLLGSGVLPQGQQPIKVYVTEGDITNTQNKVKVIQGNSDFGNPG